MKVPNVERESRLLFNLTNTVGPVRFSRLVDRFGSSVEALRVGPKAWIDVEGFGEKAGAYFSAVEEALPRLRDEVANVAPVGARVVCAPDDEYPEAFRRLLTQSRVVSRSWTTG